MKKLLTLIAATLIVASTFSQSPDKMTYQAVVRDANQSLVTSQAIGIQISILQGSPTGTIVYTETQTPTTNINGLLSIEIGGGSGFDLIDWTNGPYFINTEIDPLGGTNYTITGSSEFISVPYALHSTTAQSVIGPIEEFDPYFIESVAAGITESDTASWNNKLDTEIDGDVTNELQNLFLQGDTAIVLTDGGFVVLPDETDPVFGASIASSISSADTASWNHHTDSTDIANMGYIAFLNLTQNSEGQITISDNGGGTPDPSAILELQSTTKGFLLPRMTLAEIYAIANPPKGLLVLESATSKIYIRSSNSWNEIISTDDIFISTLEDAHSNNLQNSYYIGDGAGQGFDQSANYTTAVGSDAGVGFGTGDFNTAIGAETGPATGTQDLHHTTTIGYNAKAEYSYQLVLGTSEDTVIIPNTINLNPQNSTPTGSSGKLYVKDADKNLYYHNGNDWEQLNNGYAVGDFAMGGIVFYVDETGKHGLVCYPEDIEASMRWAQSINNVTYAQGDGIYAGEMNTAIAIAALGSQGDPSAVLSCIIATSSSPFTTNYGDWYLPSKEELLLMYSNLSTINATIITEGVGTVIGADKYWSSTEHNQVVNEAWGIDFSTGLEFQDLKQSQYHVRPVRRF